MKTRKWKSGVSFLMAAAMVMGSMSFTEAARAEAADGEASTAKTYYIDAANGNDENDGMSEEKAWKTLDKVDELSLKEGDKVLLKAGCTWNLEKEPFEVKNAEGSKENPVIIGKYGEGDNPVINGNGNPWQTDVKAPKQDVAAVHIYNSKYITIQDLEVTNLESDAADLQKDGAVYEQSKYLLTGILVENEDAGDLPGVVIKDNYVHDVNGYMNGGAVKGSGGIIALVTGGQTESFYTDLQIIGNKVEKVCHEAIYMESCWAARKLVGGQNSQDAGKNKWVGWPDVYVANNYVNAVAGDGIVLINADGGIAEYNLVTESASEDWDYKRNPAHAAIWMWDCNNVTMQYNEAAYTETTQDGMAFDCDYGNQNVMYQYNYSHDNKGGFWMACPGPYYTVNSVVRYNVSVNDGLFDGSRIIRIGEKGSIGHQVYNNTIYWNKGYKVDAVQQATWGTAPSSGTDIYNNIFYGDNGSFVTNSGVNYDSNCVWGGAKDQYPTEEDVNAVIADPMLTDVTDYTTGTFENGKVTLGSPTGFTLKSDSPCINAGRDYMAVPEESFTAVASELVPTQITLENRDYDKNAVPFKTGDKKTEYVDIGAFEYQGAGSAQAVESNKTYLQGLINLADSYKEADFLPDGWKALKIALESAKSALERPTATQKAVDANASKLESAFSQLKKQSDIKENTAADDTLADYNKSETKDNSGFEGTEKDWGEWHSTSSITEEQHHSGSKSLKVKTTNEGTAYSEIGDVPVENNTEYVCEAWVYCSDADAAKVNVEAKHHKNVTGSSDIKLANKTAEGIAADADGWRKIVLNFTTDNYNKISLSIGSDVDTVYLDDVVLYKKYTVTETVLDKAELEATLAVVPKQEQSYYAPKTWKAYEDALLQAKLARVHALATQDSINQAATNLQSAYRTLTKKANSIVLAALYKVYADDTKGNFTDASWNAYQNALKNAKAVLDNPDALQSEVDSALNSLKNTHYALQEKTAQVITYTKSYTKTYGSKPFTLNAKVKSGSLKYSTSDKNVAVVSGKGVVTLKGPGICKIKITASATGSYNAKTVEVTINVKPKATSVKSAKAVGKKKMKVQWKKSSKATGYQIQYSTSKKFKSGTKSVYVKKNVTAKTFTKLKKGKKYYVRVRAYKNAKSGGKTVKLYSSWSKAKTSTKIK